MDDMEVFLMVVVFNVAPAVIAAAGLWAKRTFEHAESAIKADGDER